MSGVLRDMNYWPIIICGLLGMGIVFLVTPLLLKVGLRGNLLQRGQELHHTHQTPVPRLGGLALAAAFVGTEFFIAAVYPEHRTALAGRLVILTSSLAMFALGFWDDLKPLGARRKLFGQILIAMAVGLGAAVVASYTLPSAAMPVASGLGVTICVRPVGCVTV